MFIDFSILENIDFTNRDNLIFLAVFLVVAVILFSVFVIIVKRILKIIKKLIVRIFNFDVKKPKLNQGDAIWLHDQPQKNKEPAVAPKPKITGDYSANLNAGEKKPEENKPSAEKSFKDKEEKSISEGLDKLKVDAKKREEKDTLASKMPLRTENQEADAHQEIKIPTSKKYKEEHSKEEYPADKLKYDVADEKNKGIVRAPNINQKVEDDDLMQVAKKLAQKEKEDKEGGLEDKEIIISSGLHGSQLTYEKEKIEAARKNLDKQKGGAQKEVATKDLHGNALVYEKEKIEAARKNLNEQKKGLKGTIEMSKGTVEGSKGTIEKLKEVITKDLHGNALTNGKKIIAPVKKISSDKRMEEEGIMFSDEPGTSGKNLIQKSKENKTISQDGSIFGGDPEVSRIKLEYKMRRDPKIWQAQRQVMLNLTPLERSKLVKEVFSPVYGRNISKKDLKWSIKKLNQKLVNVKDNPKEHEKIRKEIKFFRKIGGIK